MLFHTLRQLMLQGVTEAEREGTIADPELLMEVRLD